MDFGGVTKEAKDGKAYLGLVVRDIWRNRNGGAKIKESNVE